MRRARLLLESLDTDVISRVRFAGGLVGGGLGYPKTPWGRYAAKATA